MVNKLFMVYNLFIMAYNLFTQVNIRKKFRNKRHIDKKNKKNRHKV